MIDGVTVKQLRVIPDERGWLMEIIRRDDPFFLQFGQTYITAVYPGVVKGWHWHKLQTDHFCVIKGMIKTVLYDRRAGSSTEGETNEFFMGERNPIVVTIPKGVLHGMKGIGPETGILLNLVTEPYNYREPDEYRVDPHSGEIPYDWSRKDG